MELHHHHTPPPPIPPPSPRHHDDNDLQPLYQSYHHIGVFSVVSLFIVNLTCAKYAECAKKSQQSRDHEAREDVVNEDLVTVIHNPIVDQHNRLDDPQIESYQFSSIKETKRWNEEPTVSIC
ncbi:hypothetical protein R6Q59_000557 [Mikania micrantha]